jgi:hypothetical protein
MSDYALKSVETLSEFRQQIMEPDYAAFREAPTDLRLAFHAATSLFQLRDWVASALSLGRYELQKKLEGRCKYFNVITDVANASKHLELDDRRRTSMADAGDVRLQGIGVGGCGVGLAGYDQAGAYGLVPAIVVAPEGVLFADAADSVHRMWADFFEEHGWPGTKK